MTDDEFMRKMLDAFPDAEAGQDNDGQLVVYTDLYYDQNGIIRSYSADSQEWCVIVGDKIYCRCDTRGEADDIQQEIPSATVEWRDNPGLTVVQ